MQRSREICEMKIDEAVMLLLRAAGLDDGSEMPSGALAKPRILGSLALAIVQVGTIIGQKLYHEGTLRYIFCIMTKDSRLWAHPSRRFQLLFGEIDRYQDALKLNEEFVEVRKRILGENHHDCIHSINCFGVLYFKLDRTEGALVKLKKSLTRKELIGEDHDKTLGAIIHSLAICARSLTRRQEALELDKKVLEENWRNPGLNLRSCTHSETWGLGFVRKAFQI